MDTQQALDDLTEISSQIQAAVVLDANGKLAGSTLADGEPFAQAAAELLSAADELRTGSSRSPRPTAASSSCATTRRRSRRRRAPIRRSASCSTT